MKANRRHTARERQSALISENVSNGSSTLSFISGMGLGAGIMYVFDPDRGNRRRAMAQQKLYRIVRRGGEALDKGARDLEHRVEGLLFETRSVVRRERVPDDVLEQRVRAKLGRVACHPSSIEVGASGGHITLTGPVLRGEAVEVTRAARRVRGVRSVFCRLEEHDSSETVPGLQGRGERAGDMPELLQENWAPGTRLLMGGLGLTMILRGVRNPGFVNGVLGVAGLALLARSGRRTRLAGEFMEALKPGAGSRAGRRRDAEGVLDSSAAAQSRTSEVAYSAASSARRGDAEARVSRRLSAAEIDQLLRAREIPRSEWLHFFNQLEKSLDGRPVTVEVREQGRSQVLQRDIALDGFSADVKDRESTITITVGRDADNQVTHLIRAKRVALKDDSGGKLLEVEATDGDLTCVRFRPSDVRSDRAA